MPRILLKERGGSFGNADTGGAWLSSARAVRCWVKSATSATSCLVAIVEFGTLNRLPGDKPRKVGDDVKSSCPLCPGRHTCYNGRTKGRDPARNRNMMAPSGAPGSDQETGRALLCQRHSPFYLSSLAELSPRAAELTSLLESRISHFYTNFQVDEIGRVVSVGDGIARVYGLNEIQAGEMVEFASGVKGIALNLENENVGLLSLL
ncbi:hypothetical protein HAX54_022903 [Datura stramonium]|uniref:ATPase F1/V1/A1 complex alpha/beta subunit N-terminal domain-containing protein n=1 Tax=Datura stramonium TaxID=4076 RepID=A0ABS8UXL0_DATST|nr:hypothetical protein [Datura stramonium]